MKSKNIKIFVLFIIFFLLIFLGLFIGKNNLSIKSVSNYFYNKLNPFNPNEIIKEFNEWKKIKINETNGNILEVANIEYTVTFSRESELEAFGKKLPLGKLISKITVPAFFRYHIDLKDNWIINHENDKLVIVCPKISPSFPVAFDTNKVKKKTISGWARWDKQKNLEELEKSITKKLKSKALSNDLTEKARDSSRNAVKQFVKLWLVDKNYWGDKKFNEIKIIFQDEIRNNNINP